MEWNKRLATIMVMQSRGGSFVKALANAWWSADKTNAAKIEAAFPEYIEKYTAIAEQEKGDA